MHFTIIKKLRNNIIVLFLLVGVVAQAGVRQYDLINLGSSYNTSVFCDPPQSGLFSINIDEGTLLSEGKIYRITEGSQTNYYLILEKYSYGNQGLQIMYPDSAVDIGYQSSICDQNSTEFQGYEVKSFGDDLRDIECNFQGGEQIFNIESDQILQENEVYRMTVNGATNYYLILDVLSPSQGYSELNVSNISAIGRLSDVCGSLLPKGRTSISSSQNYIHSVKLRQPISSANYINDNTQRIEKVTYIDELGRPKQTVNLRQGGLQEDVVEIIDYDSQGRKSKEYLPFSIDSPYKGEYQGSAKFYQGSFYNTSKYEYTNNPFTEHIFDGSPKDLIVESGAPGEDWAVSSQGSHTLKKNYQLMSSSDDVKYFSINYNSSLNPFNPTLVDNGFFMDQQGARPALYKFITKNENWQSGDGNLNTIQNFVDYENRKVLKREFVIKDGSERRVDTYYVYDDYGNLIYVITPEAKASSQTVTQTILDDFCYQYVYDAKNRLIEKKLPGVVKVDIVYNKLGEPIMTQDGELREENKWVFTKYDELGRIVYTGILISSGDRESHQDAADAISTVYETRKTDSPLNLGEAELFYSNNSYPKTGISEVYSIQYYDTYLSNGADGYSAKPSVNDVGELLTSKTKGLLTVSRVKVMESNPSQWINTIHGYEKYGRLIWKKKENEYLSTTDYVHNDIDFDGNIVYSKTKHRKSDYSTNIYIYDYYTYDHLGRLKEHSQKVNSQPKELITRNYYDEIGKLETKKVGGDVNGNGLQEVDFEYNIRGWLTEVNNVNALGDDVFAFKLNYNDRNMNLSGTTNLYNGNISEMIWRTANTESYGNRKRGYGYSYDNLDRITNAYFRRASSSNSYTEQTNHYNVTGITYDLNGNIGNLVRKGVMNSSNSINTMDNLSLSYAGNQLMDVDDSAVRDYGFIDKSLASNDYDYDDNGNLIKDNNKGVTSIQYNHLNLPKRLDVQTTSGNGYLNNTYSADGIKLEKYNSSTGNRTFYSDNFIYEKNSSGSLELKFFAQPEGYVEVNSGNFQYIYQYKDHQGNIRLNYADLNNDNLIDPTANELLDEKNYYPFGLKHKGYNENINSYYHPYGYNNNEEIEDLSLDYMDFNTRNYNPGIGRFMGMDLLAEDLEQMHISPYAFSWNNPIKLSDHTGMKPRADYEPDYDKWRKIIEDAEFAGKFGAKTYISLPDSMLNGNKNGDPGDKGGSKVNYSIGANGVKINSKFNGNSNLLNNTKNLSNGLTLASTAHGVTTGIVDSFKFFNLLESSKAFGRYAQLGNAGLGAFSIGLDAYSWSQGSLSNDQFGFNTSLNGIMIAYPPAAFGIIPGKYMGEKYAPEVRQEIRDPESNTTRLVKGVLHFLGLPASAEEEPYTPWYSISN